MSAASLASFVYNKLSGSTALTPGSNDKTSLSQSTSPNPKLTTVWKTKIPGHIDMASIPPAFKEDGSLLRLLRAKSMPSLVKEKGSPFKKTTPVVLPFSPTFMTDPYLHSSTSSSLASPITSKHVNPRRNLDDSNCLDSSSNTSIATPPPSPSGFTTSHKKLTRSVSDGHIIRRRKQLMRNKTYDFPSASMPSVKTLRLKFDTGKQTDSYNTAGSKTDLGLCSNKTKVKQSLYNKTENKSDEITVKSMKDTQEPIKYMDIIRHENLRKFEHQQDVVPNAEIYHPPRRSVKSLLKQFESSLNSCNDDEIPVFHTSLRESRPRKRAVQLYPSTDSQKCLAFDIKEEIAGETANSDSVHSKVVLRQRSKSLPVSSENKRNSLANIPAKVQKLRMQFERQIEPVESIPLNHNLREKENFTLSPIEMDEKKSDEYRNSVERKSHSKIWEDDNHAPFLGDSVLESGNKGNENKPNIELKTPQSPSVKNLRKHFETPTSPKSIHKNEIKDRPLHRRHTIALNEKEFNIECEQRNQLSSQTTNKYKDLNDNVQSKASVKSLLMQFEPQSSNDRGSDTVSSNKDTMCEGKKTNDHFVLPVNVSTKPSEEVLIGENEIEVPLELQEEDSGEEFYDESGISLRLKVDSKVDHENINFTAGNTKRGLLERNYARIESSSDDYSSDEEQTSTCIKKDKCNNIPQLHEPIGVGQNDGQTMNSESKNQECADRDVMETEKHKEIDSRKVKEQITLYPTEEATTVEMIEPEQILKEEEQQTEEKAIKKANLERIEKKKIELLEKKIIERENKETGNDINQENADRKLKEQEKAEQENREQQKAEKEKIELENAAKEKREQEKADYERTKEEQLEQKVLDHKRQIRENEERAKHEQGESKRVVNITDNQIKELKLKEKETMELERKQQEGTENENVKLEGNEKERIERENVEYDRKKKEQKQTEDQSEIKQPEKELEDQEILVEIKAKNELSNSQDEEDKQAIIQLNHDKELTRKERLQRELETKELAKEHKVGKLVDKFTTLQATECELKPPDACFKSEETEQSHSKVVELTEKFANIKTEKIDSGRSEPTEENRGEGRRESDVSLLIEKFANVKTRKSSSSSHSGEEDFSTTKNIENAPVATVGTTNIPSKVRGLNDDELRFFNQGGAALEPFVRSQSLRAKKNVPPPFQQRWGSLRIKGSEPYPASGNVKDMPKSCRQLRPDELRFFAITNNNIYPTKKSAKKNLQSPQDFRLGSQGDHKTEAIASPGEEQGPLEDCDSESDSDCSLLRDYENDEESTDEALMLPDEHLDISNISYYGDNEEDDEALYSSLTTIDSMIKDDSTQESSLNFYLPNLTMLSKQSMDENSESSSKGIQVAFRNGEEDNKNYISEKDQLHKMVSVSSTHSNTCEDISTENKFAPESDILLDEPQTSTPIPRTMISLKNGCSGGNVVTTKNNRKEKDNAGNGIEVDKEAASSKQNDIHPCQKPVLSEFTQNIQNANQGSNSNSIRNSDISEGLQNVLESIGVLTSPTTECEVDLDYSSEGVSGENLPENVSTSIEDYLLHFDESKEYLSDKEFAVFCILVAMLSVTIYFIYEYIF